jgi:hypothetical protein
LSRAAAAFAYTQGGGAIPQERLLATEVVALQFGYFNGTEWLTEWDTSLTPSLPVCVEILLTLRSGAPGVELDPLTLFSPSNMPLEKSYRLVVHLPAADASTASSDTTTTESTTEATP